MIWFPIIIGSVVAIATYNFMNVKDDNGSSDVKTRNEVLSIFLKCTINLLFSCITFIYIIKKGILKEINEYIFNIPIGIDNSVINDIVDIFLVSSIPGSIILIILFLYLKSKESFSICNALVLWFVLIINYILIYNNVEIVRNIIIFIDLLFANHFIILAFIAIYDWLHESTTDKKTKPKLDVKKLTLLWTIVVFILGVMFNIK